MGRRLALLRYPVTGPAISANPWLPVTPIRLLIIEDCHLDALSLVEELQRGGYAPTFLRVETAESMSEALARQTWDAILSDHVMPNFSAFAALQVLQAARLDLPFIVVSGAIGEETAVDLMKAGANDYIVKGHYPRLIPALERELREAAGRERRRQAEAALRESQERLQLVLDASNIGFWDRNLVTGAVQFSPRWVAMLGYTLDEIRPALSEWERLVHPDDLPTVVRVRDEHFEGLTPFYEAEYRLRTKAQEWKWILARGQVVARDAQGKPLRLTGTHTDITERKKLEKERERLIGELQQALSKVKTLSGLVPICAQCKRIRDDKGYWNQLEAYIQEHSLAQFSHSFCPECSQKLYPEIFPSPSR